MSAPVRVGLIVGCYVNVALGTLLAVLAYPRSIFWLTVGAFIVLGSPVLASFIKHIERNHP